MGILLSVRRLLCCAGSLILALVVVVQPAHAEPGAPNTQVVTVKPSRDATIDSTRPLENFGQTPALRVAIGADLNGNRFEVATLLHFDLSAIPLGATINSATLNLKLTEAAGRTPIAGHQLTIGLDRDRRHLQRSTDRSQLAELQPGRADRPKAAASRLRCEGSCHKLGQQSHPELRPEAAVDGNRLRSAQLRQPRGGHAASAHRRVCAAAAPRLPGPG